MIPDAEIHARASLLGVADQTVEKDYAMCHVLTSLVQALPELIFRGGTALSRAYWPDSRLSEDLDFVATGTVQGFGDRMSAAVETAAQHTAMSLTLRFAPPRGDLSHADVKWRGEPIRIDVNLNERLYVPVDRRKLDLPYSDFADPIVASVVALAEILGNKWFMLSDRREPRDLFDVWSALGLHGVSFDELAAGHYARYGFRPQRTQLDDAKRLGDLWETRLRHQVRHLPPFELVYGEVKEALEEWRARNPM